MQTFFFGVRAVSSEVLLPISFKVYKSDVLYLMGREKNPIIIENPLSNAKHVT
jgi:hypothetical protein